MNKFSLESVQNLARLSEKALIFENTVGAPLVSALNVLNASKRAPTRGTPTLFAKIVEILNRLLFLGGIVFVIAGVAPANAANSKGDLDKELGTVVNNYLKGPGKKEHVTGIALSVSLPPDNNIRSYFAGKISASPSAPPVTGQSLFQIGSITKSFTTAIILQLEAEGKLNINQTVGDFLPQYSMWKNVSIKRLLNMTSNIPSYSRNETFQDEVFAHPNKQWTWKELIAFANPSQPIKPPSSVKFDYSNTNYILAGMIIEAVTKHSFSDEIHKRLLRSEYGLSNTFYSENTYPKKVMDHMVRGYYYDKDKSRLITVFENNTSWAGPTGGLISNSQDIIHWVQALYLGKLFPEKQTQELESGVSVETGRPIIKGSKGASKEGFALGVGFHYEKDLGGKYWYYKGSTMGYRAAYLWKPCNNVIIAATLNSKVEEKADHINDLLRDSYKKIIAAYPEYLCRD